MEAGGSSGAQAGRSAWRGGERGSPPRTQAEAIIIPGASLTPCPDPPSPTLSLGPNSSYLPSSPAGGRTPGLGGSGGHRGLGPNLGLSLSISAGEGGHSGRKAPPGRHSLPVLTPEGLADTLSPASSPPSSIWRDLLSSEAGPGTWRRKPSALIAGVSWVISPGNGRPRKHLPLPAGPLLSPQSIRPACLPSAPLPGPVPALLLGRGPKDS